LTGVIVRQEFVDAAQHERNDARRKSADDNARDDHGRRCRIQSGQQDCNRLDEERDAERRAKSRTVGKMAGQQWTDGGAETVEHPVVLSGGDSVAEAPCDEVDEEDHVRHQRQGIKAVFHAQHPQDDLRPTVRACMRVRHMLDNRCLGWPGLPTREGQQSRQRSQAIPALPKETRRGIRTNLVYPFS
jgi:hypothetical protein